MSAFRSPRNTVRSYTIGIFVEIAYSLALLGFIALMAWAVWRWYL